LVGDEERRRCNCCFTQSAGQSGLPALSTARKISIAKTRVAPVYVYAQKPGSASQQLQLAIAYEVTMAIPRHFLHWSARSANPKVDNDSTSASSNITLNLIIVHFSLFRVWS